LAEPGQDKFALSAARHFGAEQLKNQRISRFPNSPDRYLGSLALQATQAAAIDKRFRILAYRSTAKLGNALARQAQND
jgi:hypothetical protein